ncbi:sn-glycerol-3-phosphate ABC transporter ATP-binding protein UgpC [uncultured Martelella sp.]|uniref:ABC transporter ATP-binding protein n=1 Tax=uncultured Martelella sp. TaxID=392331 RepID=UPI0029C7A4E0|nr:sn-glycerol-3-phosphate ABC transporter ATP-binding protein UgpC [uncultured Martelella sp.]
MAPVSIRNIRKDYGSVNVLKDISVEIADGEFVVLVGPSGCGKSTLLRMIAGLEDISGGEISIDGKVVNDLPPKQRDISMVFQNYALYPHMTVFENMAFSMTLAGAPAAEKEKKVTEAADILGLTPLLKRYPRQLSGGQRQRVAMGRSIVRNPKVFLFDEPLSNLDAKLRVQMRAEIKALHKRLGTTIIYVTHDQVEAMTMADKIVVLNGGGIEQAGSPLDLYDTPRNAFVAQFIGSPSMNLLELENRAGQLVFENGEPSGLAAPANVDAGRTILVGKRPEDLVAAEAGVKAEVGVVEPTGSEIFAQLTIHGQAVSAVFRERIDIEYGTTIQVRFDHGATHYFDADTGKAL